VFTEKASFLSSFRSGVASWEEWSLVAQALFLLPVATVIIVLRVNGVEIWWIFWLCFGDAKIFLLFI
jgi:hypothetical protein